VSTRKARSRAGPRLVDGTIPPAQFAKDQGVTIRTVQRWLAAGMPCRLVNGERRIRVVDGCTWVRSWEYERGRETAATPAEANERGRKLAAEASLRELDLHERRRDLVPLREHEEALEAFVGGFAAVASGQLQRFEKQIVQAVTPAEARAVTTGIHRALMEGAQRYADQLEAEAAALEAVAAAGNDGEAA
jgi:hypothetical protein